MKTKHYENITWKIDYRFDTQEFSFACQIVQIYQKAKQVTIFMGDILLFQLK